MNTGIAYIAALSGATLSLAPARVMAQEEPRIGVFDELADARMASVSAELDKRISAAGFRVSRLSAGDLRSRLDCDLLLYAAGKRFPSGAENAIRTFLRQGGRMIVLGGPAFSEPCWNMGGIWRTWADLQRALSESRPDYLALDFEKPSDTTGWIRAANAPESPGSVSTNDFGGGHGRSLQVDIANLTGWDGWGHAVSNMPAGRNLITFRARGDAQTGQMMMELREKDGSRWIAITPLSTGWRFFALGPEDFKYWRDSASVGRGGADDRVRLENVAQIGVGLAFSHTPVSAGRHRFWIDEIGVQRDPRTESGPSTEPLRFESLSPADKYFPVRGAISCGATSNQALIPAGEYPVGASIASVSPRPQGTGFMKGRSARFVQLITVRGSSKRRTSYAAWLQINYDGVNRGSAWAVFGVNDPAFYNAPKVQQAVVQLARAMTQSPLLLEGGSTFYACLPADRTLHFGALVAPPSLSSTPAPITMRLTATVVGQSKPAYVHTWAVPSAGRPVRFTADWTPNSADWNHGAFTVRTELYQNGRLVDVLSHPLTVWRPKPPNQRGFVTARNGSFQIGGRRWSPHGVNYMPSSGIALDDQEAFEDWMDSRAYDPDVVEEDLARIESIGMNSISVFAYHKSMESRNLLDLLIRAERHGLKVNLSLRPHADPFDFNWEEVRDLIDFSRLPENDTVFAYDLAWERGFGNYEPSYYNVKGRKGYDAAWRFWLVERYGSVENAEADWGVSVPRRDGQITGPSDEMLDKDGPHRRLIAAYRRFVDDLTSRAYGRVARQIRGIDPHHLISFRMTIAGDPTAPPREFPFDFRGLGRALDIMEPEGYGRIGEWNRVRDGAFTVAYSRFAAPGRPVYWAEFGQSAWSGGNFIDKNPALDTVGRFYQYFYRMIGLSRSNGSSAWWFPGGYRQNENSDYGILNPDGSDRPVTAAIRQWLPKLNRAVVPADPRVDTWIEVDRDADARGLAGIYLKCRDAFWKAVEAGRNPGLRDAGTGATSRTAPLIAVGGTPYNGSNPPRFLNAEFDRMEILDSKGRWVDVSGGIFKRDEVTVEVRPAQPIIARATVGNTEAATWIALGNSPAGAAAWPRGAVALATTANSELRMREPAPIPRDIPMLGTAVLNSFVLASGITKETRVVVQMTAWKRMWFGEKIAFRLRPVRPNGAGRP